LLVCLLDVGVVAWDWDFIVSRYCRCSIFFCLVPGNSF
jgi:hypothetical protein